MSVAPLQWLGKVSFSAYMFHGVVTQWLFVVMRAIEGKTGETFIIMRGEHEIIALPEAWMNNALLAAYVVLVMVGAHFIYRWVENPSRIYFADLSKKVLVKPEPKPAPNLEQGAAWGESGAPSPSRGDA
jgi:peptidoglycan/LPS O-acetylase OafA/YrhL